MAYTMINLRHCLVPETRKQLFETTEELRQALLAFREIYNESWLIRRPGFLSPAAFRQKQLQPVAKAA